MIIGKIKRSLKKYLNKMELFPYIFVPVYAKRDRLVIVTGADSSHYRSLCQFLSSLLRHEPSITVVIFDLGLAGTERRHLKEAFPAAELRRFDFAQYPDYFNIKVNAGEYAWKPVILCDVFNEFRRCTCWMDAGNVVTGSLMWVRKITKKEGMYSPYSDGRISDWTHPETLRWLNASEELLHKRNLSGCCVSLNFRSPAARNLAAAWKECALTRECIAPHGSNRRNHRQDQAVLSVLAHQSGITKRIPAKRYNFKAHQDVEGNPFRSENATNPQTR